MDVDGIPFGVDFHEYLLEAVSRAKIVLVLIASNWAEASDESGNRRLDDPDDFVASKLKRRLSSMCLLAPLLIDGAAMPKAPQLPDTLAQLTRRNAASVDSGRDFNQHCERLIADLRQYVSNPSAESEGHETNQSRKISTLTSLSPISASDQVPNVSVAPQIGPMRNLMIKVTVARQLLTRKNRAPSRTLKRPLTANSSARLRVLWAIAFRPLRSPLGLTTWSLARSGGMERGVIIELNYT